MLSKLALWRTACALAVVALLVAACAAPAATPTATPSKFVFGLVMVGPKEDHGWNQAHWEAAQRVLQEIPNSELVWLDKVNQADRPGTTVEQIADDFASKGAKVIFTNSAEFKDPTNNAAKAHPDITFIHISGDAALDDDSAPKNVGNFMGRMEYGKMIAGCAAALTTEKGNIAYLGPLIDSETRRLVNSAFLGARYCWEKLRGKDPAELKFTVTWIGFWLNIPGVTLDPTQVANDFFNNGADIIISGIDTTEGLVVTGQHAAKGEKVWAIPYDYVGACEEAKDVCLGVPYFNWAPAYLKTIKQVQQGIWEQKWDWNGPDWADLNNADSSAVGWVDGAALAADNKAQLQTFIKGLGDGSIDLYVGPLKFQDGTDFLLDKEKATDRQIWYTPQLLEGIEGKSQ